MTTSCKKFLALGALLCNLLLLLFLGNRTQIFHIDETFSYGFANNNSGAYLMPDSLFSVFYPGEDEKFKDLYFDRFIDTKLLHDYITVQPDHRFDYASAVKNAGQDIHPPLYFILLHTVCSFFPDELSRAYAGVINLVVFLLLYVVFYRFSALILGDKYKNYALFPLLFWGFSSIGLNTVLFLRMYAMQTLFYTGLLYHTAKIIKNPEPKKADFFAVFLYTLLGVFTQYNSLVLSVILCFTAVVLLALQHRISSCSHMFLAVFSGIALLFVIFPDAARAILFSERGTAMQGIVVDFFEDPLYQIDLHTYRFLDIFLKDYFNLPENFKIQTLYFTCITEVVFLFVAICKKPSHAGLLILLVSAFLAVFEPLSSLLLSYIGFRLLNRKPISSGEVIFLGLFGSIFYISLFMPPMNRMDWRYFSPFFPFLSILTVYGCLSLFTKLPLSTKQISVILCSCFLALSSFNALKINQSITNINRAYMPLRTDISGKTVFLYAEGNVLAVHNFFRWLQIILPAKQIYWLTDFCTPKTTELLKAHPNAYLFVKRKKEKFMNLKDTKTVLTDKFMNTCPEISAITTKQTFLNDYNYFIYTVNEE
jgi:hypothetical protein